MTPEFPKEIGRYIIETKIGQGSMGEVYRAIDNRIHRSIAIKTLRLSNLKTEQERSTARNLFLQEARITGKLNHANITTIHDMGIHDNKPFLVMEYVKGQDLSHIIANNINYPFKQKIKIIAAIARTIHYANQRGILHRDIKPANIMILKNGIPKIMDFGIAGIVNKSSSKTRKDSTDQYLTFFGTPQYMSPEQVKRRKYDRRSEVFCLGILAYEWLSGQKPFSGQTLKELLYNIIISNYRKFPSELKIDFALQRIINKALQTSPKNRYQNSEDFADSIELYLNKIEMENEPSPTYSSFDRDMVIEKLRHKYIFFSDFTKQELITIFKLSRQKKYMPGEYIIREGTPGTKMYVILSGRVSIKNDTNGQEIEIGQFGAGSCVGEMALVDKRKRSASVVALESTTTIAINETVLRLSNPAICLKFYRSLASMLSEKLRAHDIRYRELLAKIQ